MELVRVWRGAPRRGSRCRACLASVALSQRGPALLSRRRGAPDADAGAVSPRRGVSFPAAGASSRGRRQQEGESCGELSTMTLLRSANFGFWCRPASSFLTRRGRPWLSHSICRESPNKYSPQLFFSLSPKPLRPALGWERCRTSGSRGSNK